MNIKYNELIEYAYIHCEYYKKQILNENSVLSITQEEFQKNYQNIISDEYAKKLINTLSVFGIISDGGYVQKYFWNTNGLIKSNYNLWKMRKAYYNISFLDKCCCVHKLQPNGMQLHSYDNSIIYDNNLTFKSILIFDLNIDYIVDLIIRFKPSWLLLPASSLILLYDHMKRKNIKLISLKYIEYYDNNIPRYYEKTIEDYFKCKVAYLHGYIYGGFSLTDPNGYQHIITNNVCFDVKDNHFLITSLNNYACPFIKHIDNLSIVKEYENLFEIINDKSFDYYKHSINEKMEQIIIETNNIYFNSIMYYNLTYPYKQLYIKLNLKYKLWENTIKSELYERIIKNDLSKLIKDKDNIIFEYIKC